MDRLGSVGIYSQQRRFSGDDTMTNNLDELIEIRAVALSDLKRVKEKIQTDFGHDCRVQFDSLEFVYTIFSDNVKELSSWSREDNFPKFKMPPEKEGNMELADSYFQELIRLIHNTLGSITTYMDQSRRIMKKLSLVNDSFIQSYETMVADEFANDPLTNFLKGFRNFIHHIDLVDYFVEHHYDWREGRYQSRLVIDIYKLKRWEKWNTFGRKYLDSLDRIEISIHDQLDEFDGKLIRFRSWFIDEFKKHYSSEVATTDALYAEHKRLAAIGYEEHIKNFGYTEEMKIPRSRGHYSHTANLPPR